MVLSKELARAYASAQIAGFLSQSLKGFGCHLLVLMVQIQGSFPDPRHFLLQLGSVLGGLLQGLLVRFDFFLKTFDLFRLLVELLE